jgi:4-hydroxybenzoyl-CoA thioesterase
VTFTRAIPVRFRDCDPAGIVFYPRYFEMMNDVLEDWFAELGLDFAAMHRDTDGGVPTLSLRAEFLRPSYLGDALEWSLTVTRLGESSFALAYAASCAGEARVRAEATLVFVENDRESMKSRPIPAILREKMLRYQGVTP